MKSEKGKSGRFLIIAIFFLLFISTAQGAWDNDDLMYAKGTTGGQSMVHNIDTEKDFTTIYDAIDDPDTKDGHTISVDAGNYPKPGISPKPVVINKQLKLRGVDKDTTIIDGDGSGNCIKVTADNVEISGFTIKNGRYGVYLEASNCHVIDNNIASIDFDGIFLSNSVNNTIAHNSISKVKRIGIRLSSSCNNRIHDNDLSENDKGIVLFASPDNIIYHNNFIDNRNQAKDNRDTNRWDNGPIDGGNYWSDHKCTGNPSDGSQPYKISVGGAKDTYPFMDKDGWTCTLPSPPTLADPGTNDNDGNYTVSWSSVTSATNYTLEEDTSSSFSSPTKIYSGLETSKEITDKSDGTYYYQVKACNECGCSDWSNKENITIKIDTILPTVTITYPTDGQTFTTFAITVNGTASDNVAVSKVEVKIGSGDWQNASGTTSWNRSVTLVPGRSNTIYARAADRSGNTKNTSVKVICDITPPDIYHEPITNATEGDTIPISATITDDTTKVANASLSYRITGEEAWITISMDHIGDNYSATIPASHVTTAGVEYYIGAVDNAANTANKPEAASKAPYSITVKVNVGYAIIIAGITDKDPGREPINISANSAYCVLSNRGFTRERIFYLNPSKGQYVDRISSSENIHDAISWAYDNVSVNVPLLIYMVGHCENDKFIVNGKKDIITASSLNNSLNLLTNGKGCEDITVVCEACNSGSFIDDLSYYNHLSKCGRIIVSSTGVNAYSILDEKKGGVFSYYFFNSINDGNTIKVAFADASNSPEIEAFSDITPMLDDNGDCKGHGILEINEEGSLAGSKYIGRQCGARDFALTNAHSNNNWIPAIKLEEV